MKNTFTTHVLLLALCAIVGGFSLDAEVLANEAPSIYGIHDHEPAPWEYLNKVKNSTGRGGWVTATVRVWDFANNTGANFTNLVNQGHTVICRINNGYGSEGTIPIPAEYDNFAAKCANFAQYTTGTKIFLIGNETNLPSEWPLHNGRYSYISPQDYATCFRKVYNAIKAVRPDAKVLPQATALFAGPLGAGTQNGYPHDAVPINWVDYQYQMLDAIRQSGGIDGISLHIGSRGYAYSDIHSTQTISAGGKTLYWSFYSYKDWINYGIPTSLYHLPIYATECNGYYYWKGGHPEAPSKTYEAGFVQEVLAEINRYNMLASLTGKPIFRCVNFYRWCAYCDDWNIDGTSNPYKGQIMNDLDSALTQDYIWPAVTPVLVDNVHAGFTVESGSWSVSTTLTDKWGTNYRTASTTTNPSQVKWTPTLPQSGYYQVYVWYPQHSSRPNNAPYTVNYLGGSQTFYVNQTTFGGRWNALGKFPFVVGGGSVTLSANAQAGKTIAADAVLFEYKGPLPSISSVQGYVRDSLGSGISGVRVSLGPGKPFTFTDSNGWYELTEVEPGYYNMTAQRPGYTREESANFLIGLGSNDKNFTLNAALSIGYINAPSSVTQGQSGVSVTLSVTNSGPYELRITSSTPNFFQGASNVSSHYTVIPSPSNTSVIGPGQTKTLNYTVNVGINAPAGTTTVQGTVNTYANLIPNGSFEDDTLVPPLHWGNWGTAGSYALDSSASDGAQSYRFNFTSVPNQSWITSSTYSGEALNPIWPGIDYHNRVSHRRQVTTGNINTVLVFEQYDALQNLIGTAATLTLPSVTNWTESGTTYYVTEDTYFYRVWLGMQSLTGGTTASAWFDNVRLYSNENIFDNTANAPGSWNVIPANQYLLIGEAKNNPDNTLITLQNKIVSANLGSAFWIQEPDRASAIRVEGSYPDLTPGKIVTITGNLTTIAGERNITNPWITVNGTQNPPLPLNMMNRVVAGPALNQYTPGVTDALASGAHNVGLYISVFGKVTAVPGSDYFYLDDGQGLLDGSGHKGIRVLASGVSPLPSVGQLVKVTGLSRLTTVNSTYVRAIRCWSNSNIVVLAQ